MMEVTLKARKKPKASRLEVYHVTKEVQPRGIGV